MITDGGRALWKFIHQLNCKAWETKKMPADWKIAVIQPVLKRGDKMDCNNYRRIS
jgi:hypothetical protein